MSKFAGPVVPIPPAFDENEKLDIAEIGRYLNFLSANGIDTIMTTVGTSLFNLLSMEEINRFNRFCVEYFEGNCILGLPAMSSRNLKEELANMCGPAVPETVAPMILFPERHYYDHDLVQFFHDIADFADRPIFIHGMWMRGGRGGFVDVSSAVINDIAAHPNIVGMKEETRDLNQAFNILSEVAAPDFVTIVAGGSMRRWSLLKEVGATTFLSGIGNLFPKIEIEYMKAVSNGEREKERKLLGLETKLFGPFMRNGWHKSLRFGLNHLDLMTTGNRAPFSKMFGGESIQLMEVLDELKELVGSDECLSAYLS